MSPEHEGPDMSQFASENENRSRKQGEDIVRLLLSPDIGRLITESGITAQEQDLIQEIDTPEDFISKPPEKQKEILTVYRALLKVR